MKVDRVGEVVVTAGTTLEEFHHGNSQFEEDMTFVKLSRLMKEVEDKSGFLLVTGEAQWPNVLKKYNESGPLEE